MIFGTFLVHQARDAFKTSQTKLLWSTVRAKGGSLQSCKHAPPRWAAPSIRLAGRRLREPVSRCLAQWRLPVLVSLLAGHTLFVGPRARAAHTPIGFGSSHPLQALSPHAVVREQVLITVWSLMTYGYLRPWLRPPLNQELNDLSPFRLCLTLRIEFLKDRKLKLGLLAVPQSRIG